MDLPSGLFGKQGNFAPRSKRYGDFVENPRQRNRIGKYLPGSLCSLSSYYILGVPCLGFPVTSL